MLISLSSIRNLFLLETEALRISARFIPWDSLALDFPVGAIDSIELFDDEQAKLDFDSFVNWTHQHQYRLISCRVGHERIRESIFLESKGFRFIEMVLHPAFLDLQNARIQPNDVVADEPDEGEVAKLVDIASRAFRYERFHMDPRLRFFDAGRRYGNWVGASYKDKNQRLLKIVYQRDIVGFFITESIGDFVYWHLTAIAPESQGRGIGYKAWKAMMNLNRSEGISSIRTTVSARNCPVLNLYSKLNFHFLPPEMTLHWTNFT